MSTQRRDIDCESARISRFGLHLTCSHDDDDDGYDDYDDYDGDDYAQKTQITFNVLPNVVLPVVTATVVRRNH